eukprot:m.15697 g.15697  ORF g.15697 m.15697 type:complete len:456 (-) comp10799_c0_seq2:140-1507(-)
MDSIVRGNMQQQKFNTALQCFHAEGTSDRRIKVGVSVNVRKLISIDVEAQTFDAEVIIRASWVDEDIEKLYDAGECIFFSNPYFDDPPETNAWAPRIQVTNAVGEIRNLENWYIPNQGTACKDYFCLSGKGSDYKYKWRVSQLIKCEGTFLSSMDLSCFPMDEHYLAIKVKACVPQHIKPDHAIRRREGDGVRGLKLADIVVFNPDDDDIDSTENIFFKEDGFCVKWSWRADTHLALQESYTTVESSINKTRYASLAAYLHVVRNPWPLFLNVMIVHFGICTASLAVLTFDEEVNRIESLFTILTAAVAHKFVAIQNLPALPYLTTMDKYVFAGIGLIFVLLIETVIGSQLPDDKVDDYDHIFRNVLTTFWGLYNLYTFIYFVSWGLYGRRVNAQTGATKKCFGTTEGKDLMPRAHSWFPFLRGGAHLSLRDRYPKGIAHNNIVQNSVANAQTFS